MAKKMSSHEKFFHFILIAGLTLTIGACAASETTSSGEDDDDGTETATETTVARTTESGVEALTEAMNMSAGGANVSASLSAGLVTRAGLGTAGCEFGSDGVTIDFACSDSTRTLTRTRTMEDCETPDGNMSISGSHYVQWTHLGAGACGTADDRRLYFWTAVQGHDGNNTEVIRSTDPDSPDDPVAGVIREFLDGTRTVTVVGSNTSEFSDYTSSEDADGVVTQVVTETFEIPGTTRSAVDGDGDALFDIEISTTSPLTVGHQDVDGDYTRTVASGEVQAVNDTAGVTVTHTLSDLVWNPTGELGCECHPISGSIAISVTENDVDADGDGADDEIGSGTITFLAAEEGTCGAVDASFEGVEMPFNLRNCS